LVCQRVSPYNYWESRSASIGFILAGKELDLLTNRDKLKYVGDDVLIYEMAKLIKEEVIEIGEGTEIDDFTFIYGGRGIRLGRYNHICSFVSIIGGGELITGDYVGIAAGCRILTGTHNHTNGKRMISRVPHEQQEIIAGTIVLERDVFLASNAIVYPNVTIGEGAIIGAGSLVNRDVEPWTINIGYPIRRVGERPRVEYD
jgi:acetyltransferase-like isoleucine patch superfamily enzyme